VLNYENKNVINDFIEDSKRDGVEIVYIHHYPKENKYTIGVKIIQNSESEWMKIIKRIKQSQIYRNIKLWIILNFWNTNKIIEFIRNKEDEKLILGSDWKWPKKRMRKR